MTEKTPECSLELDLLENERQLKGSKYYKVVLALK